jgi:hypothetical protein
MKAALGVRFLAGAVFAAAFLAGAAAFLAGAALAAGFAAAFLAGALAAGFLAATFFAVAIGFSGCLEGDVWGLNAWVDGPSMALGRMVMPLKAAGKGPELPR